MVEPGFFKLINMLKPCPQTKTFKFGSSVKSEDRDKEINEWKKSITLNGDQVCPNPPTFQENIDGGTTYVYTYSIPLEVAEKPVKKK